MFPVPDSFTFEYHGSDLVYGRESIAGIGDQVGDHGFDRALIVCGSNVGANEQLMDPIRTGLGDRLAGVFAETTPDKFAKTAAEGVEAMGSVDADVLVAVGGGSSLDVARLMAILESDGRSYDDLRTEAADTGRVAPLRSTDEPTPLVVVPTTFAGADISAGGSLEVLDAEESPTNQPVRVGTDDPRASPVAMVYDPDLFETTPAGPLAGSAMNGFNKGIETIYTRYATPITDGTAVHGLRLLQDGFPRLGKDPVAMDRAVTGIILVQYERKSAIIHAFGHGFSRRYPVQQGDVHAIVVPHVLRYVFSEVDARRSVIGAGLGLDPGESPEVLAEAIVDRVSEVRDSLGRPTRLRELDAVDRGDFPAVAEFIHADGPMARNPTGLAPTVADIEGILDEAW